MKHILPPLRYGVDALIPQLSALQIEYHHDKHHRGYVDNLNRMVEGTEFADGALEEIIVGSDGALFNNAAQVWNHTFYFDQFSPRGMKEPQGGLLEAIEISFGSLGSMKEQMAEAALSLFGSGWVWLTVEGRELSIQPMANAANPLKQGGKALLCIDVWEHAYYIDYYNRRADYLTAFWELVDWSVVEDRYLLAISPTL